MPCLVEVTDKGMDVSLLYAHTHDAALGARLEEIWEKYIDAKIRLEETWTSQAEDYKWGFCGNPGHSARQLARTGRSNFWNMFQPLRRIR